MRARWYANYNTDKMRDMRVQENRSWCDAVPGEDVSGVGRGQGGKSAPCINYDERYMEESAHDVARTWRVPFSADRSVGCKGGYEVE